MTDPAALCAFKDLKDGFPLGVVQGGRKLVVVKSGDGARVLDGVCPHRGAPLEDGFVHDGCVVCPWHGWAFDLESGAVRLGDQSIGARAGDVRDGKVY
jgi:nitrite reductase/ring-hydroxylating ferredoxin subunit